MVGRTVPTIVDLQHTSTARLPRLTRLERASSSKRRISIRLSHAMVAEQESYGYPSYSHLPFASAAVLARASTAIHSPPSLKDWTAVQGCLGRLHHDSSAADESSVRM